MNKTIFNFVFFVLASNCVFASTTTVIDPKNLLVSVDSFLKSSSFEQALQCGTKSDYSYAPQKCELNCGKDGCTTGCQEQVGSTLEKFVADCTADSATIYSDRGDIEEITRFDFEASGGNMARRMLNNLGNILIYDMRITIDKVEKSTYTLNRDLPDSKIVPSINIFARLQIAGVSLEPDIVISAIQGPAVAQIVRFRVMNLSWFLLKDYK